MSTAHVEVSDSNSYYFTNVRDNDMIFRTASNSQQIHFGVNSNATSQMVINSNVINLLGNVSMSSDISLTKQVNFTGIQLSRRTLPGEMQNITNTVTSVPGFLQDTSSNITVSGSNTVNVICGGTQVATFSSNSLNLGTATAPYNICAGNLGMFRNRIINGDMRINQRGVTSSNVAGNGLAQQTYFVDRFLYEQNITTGTITLSTVSLTSNDTPYGYGFLNSMRATASVACTNYSYIGPCQIIEGNNVSDLAWGTGLGTPITVSCWLRTNAPGTSVVTLAIRGGSPTHTYAFNASVTQNQWTYVSKTIPAPPSNTTWQTGTAAGITLYLGSRNSSSINADTWTQSGAYSTATTTNIFATLNNYIEFTGVQLEKGSIATPFEFRPYSTELDLCRRYYRIFGAGLTGGWGTTSGCELGVTFNPPVRIAPNVSTSAYLSVLRSNNVYVVAIGTNAGFVSGVTAQWHGTVYPGNTVNGAALTLSKSSGITVNAGNPAILNDDILAINVEL